MELVHVCACAKMQQLKEAGIILCETEMKSQCGEYCFISSEIFTGYRAA